MNTHIQLSEEEIKLGFVASCVEFVAAELGVDYAEAFAKMQKANLLRSYLYDHYEAIHTQSRQHVTEDIIRFLEKEEEKCLQ